MENTNKTNEQKAQAIFNQLKEQNSKGLSDLITELSQEYDEDESIYTLDDWLQDFSEYGRDLPTLVKIVQNSKDLSIDDMFVRESIYYNGYKTSDNILDLADDDEVIEWIEDALDDNSSYIEDINNQLMENN